MSVLSIYRGDDRTLTITSSVALTGSEVTFTAKRSKLDADEDAVIQKSTAAGVEIGDPDTAVEVTVDAADTEDLDPVALYWDVQAVDGSGNVRTVAAGRLVIKADITRSAGS